MTWRSLQPVPGSTPPGVPDRPSIRDKAAMVYYDGALWVFAGWGTRIDRTQHNSRVSLCDNLIIFLCFDTQFSYNLHFCSLVFQSCMKLSILTSYIELSLSQFVPDMSHEFVGWNNELWRFDLKAMRWNSPQCSGNAPSPRAAHTLTMYSDHRQAY